MEKIIITFKGMTTHVILKEDEVVAMKVDGEVLVIAIGAHGDIDRTIRFGFE